ncbi:MAG: 4-hydroxybenzoyl-CoA reductase subunit gamma [Alphaproteobacteria bacterium MarineAlpha5_Bin6]|nr:MAG: 4-hydroxybenzoyl-CoA reductase subunit gamma [Alphaproteobacteria bacterium MarineAlpha5_Bin6]
MSKEISFILNQELVRINDVDPNTTVLNYLRDIKNLRGTKEGCASGDCGACTAVIVELINDRLVYKSINTCIMFIYNLHGKQLITVEHLKDNTKLHPVQKSMVDYGGSQCGFCTPGFIMSMFSMYKNKITPTKKNIDEHLAGNLCRCTGYKPIYIATKNMNKYGKSDHFSKTEKKIKNKLKSINNNVAISYLDKEFFIPSNLNNLKENINEYKNFKFLSGGTDLALEVTKKRKSIESFIFLGNNNDLKYIKVVDNNILIGGATPINDTINILKKYYPAIADMYMRYGSTQIRNVATIGGNIANASPIGDSAPALISLDSSVTIEGNKTKIIKLKDFFISYKRTVLQKNEFLKEIIIPIDKNSIFKCYKISKRFDDDISAVFMAINLKQKNQIINKISITLGGMAEIPKKAINTEKFLNRKKFNYNNIIKAKEYLADDFNPINDMRASKKYRKIISQNLLEKFYYEVTNNKTISVN